MVETSDLMNIEMVNTICASQSSSASSNDSSAHNGFTNCQNSFIADNSNKANDDMSSKDLKQNGICDAAISIEGMSNDIETDVEKQSNSFLSEEQERESSLINGNKEVENGKSDLPNEPTKGNESVGTRTCISKENIPAETKQSSSVEYIELDDDDDDVDDDDDDDDIIEEPPAKKKKVEPQKSPVPDDPAAERTKKVPELTSSEALLDKLEVFVSNAIETNDNVDRKMLDALLRAINIQVQREPLSVRRLILDKQLVLPNTISLPPSQIVDLLIEHDPEIPLGKVIVKMFGEERPKLSETDRRDRHLLKLSHPAPLMTKLLMDIGQDLVQESTYSDIVHAKNLPETPKNMETYKQVAQQLKPVLEALRKKNEPYKLKQHICQLCAFKTESLIVLALHKQTPHFDGRKYQCGLCPEYFTNENMISQHYIQQHDLVPGKEEALPRNPCPCCDEDFMYKGQRDQHLKMCRRDLNRVRLIMAPKSPQDVCAINQWMWPKPPFDPTILHQQQVAQRQQAEKLQRAQLAQQQLQKRNQQFAAQKTFLAQQQQAALLLQQQRLRAAQVVAQQTNKVNSLISNPSLVAAMQQQIRAAAAVAVAGLRNDLFQARASNNARTLAASASSMANRAKNPQIPNSRAINAVASSSHGSGNVCEICDQNVHERDRYLSHLQLFHKQMIGKNVSDMQQGAPLACSRCHDRFWTYEGLERHLVMAHGLVTSDLLTKAQRKEDGGRCKLCGKQYAFNMLQHLVTDHNVKLCSAEIMYSCDVCSFKCSSYSSLETHLNTVHPKTPLQNAASSNLSAGPSQG